jgi:CO/xanthine dehydrogenase Mo-binding subunit
MIRFGGRYEPIEGHGSSAQTVGAPSVAAHLSHVRVDKETGEVEVLRHVIAQDVGRALNPALVEGQMRGGAAQGIGWALFEELAHDEDGRLVTGSFLTYAIPVAERVPEIDTLIVEKPAPHGPFGAKGIGEAPVVAAPAAIANAVARAAGVRLYELPMTPPRVWAALDGRA